ncbi:hypothetical protein HAX54_033622 [Datura stramonium]|uniref:Uncharacterized protein n=1 Tax=Datura stramonium TaxID=4076 RepID=A0ABS8VG11_DATST|nr:hypothetical protein [Datura stramonium]
MNQTYGLIVRAIVQTYGLSFMPVGSTEAAARKEISKKRQLRDNTESDNSSGSKENFEIDSSNDSAVVTTKERSKAIESVVATSPRSQFEEGREGAEYDSEDPPANDKEDGNNDIEKSEDDASATKESRKKESSA